MIEKLDLAKLNAEFESKKPQEIIAWAVNEFKGSFAMTSSFGPESGTLLHMASQIDPNIPVLFLETGYHFKETLEYRDRLVQLFGLTNIVNLKADPVVKQKFVEANDGVPYEKNPDGCCKINKVDPLKPALTQYKAWMSGIRRHQTDVRKSIQMIEEYEDHHYKVSPLANFTSRESWWYLKEHQIPQHPLYEKGYLSIGCWPCTRPVQEGDDERSGRWAGKAKKECGIHTTFKQMNKPVVETEKEKNSQGEGL